MTDAKRLDWLEAKQNGLALVHDDNQHWAVAFDGFQNVIAGDKPQDLQTSYDIEASRFRPTVREAIDLAMAQESD